MDSNISYKPLFLIATVILLCGLILLVKRWPQGKHKTFSQHAAVQKRTIVYYILLFTAVLPLILLFFVYWLIPILRIPPWFMFFVVGASAMQYACTLVPEVGGWKTKVHSMLAGISATCLLPPLAILASSSSTSVPSKVTIGLCVLLMCGIIFMVVRTRKNPTHSLFLQAGYFAAFFAAILFVTYFN